MPTHCNVEGRSLVLHHWVGAGMAAPGPMACRVTLMTDHRGTLYLWSWRQLIGPWVYAAARLPGGCTFGVHKAVHLLSANICTPVPFSAKARAAPSMGTSGSVFLLMFASVLFPSSCKQAHVLPSPASSLAASPVLPAVQVLAVWP